MPPTGDFAPSAALATLERRAALLAHMRRFFAERGYLEVETPILSRDVVVDAHLDPFIADDGQPDATGGDLYLQTSPEFAMKRLLATGATALFQVARVMRRGELGRLHNPEFTMIEWYRAGDTHHEQMTVVEDLVRSVFRRADELTGPRERYGQSNSHDDPWRNRLSAPFPRITYDDAFERSLGMRVLKRSANELAELATRRGIAPVPGLDCDDRDGWLNLLLAVGVEPELGVASPVFLYDYPASQAALAKVRPGDPPVAERFELYVAGIELCNGYHELTDADELRRRIAVQAGIRAREGRRSLPAESRLLAAMESGLPPCAGVALGFDRLAMLALRKPTVADVMAFPFDRA